MNKADITKSAVVVGILFFGALWGLSELILGEALYSAEIPYSSVILTLLALVILAVARVFLPITGISTLIAASAMLYKSLNVPFFPCHLVAILVLGVGFDLAFVGEGRRVRWLRAAGAVWFSYLAFAVLMAFVLGREPWLSGGLEKVIQHVGVSGSVAALAAMLVVPVSWRVGESIHARWHGAFSLRLRPDSGFLTLTTVGAWTVGLVGFFRGVLS